MKKLLALCLALALLLSVSALAEETAVLTPADVIGTWSSTSYELEGKTYSVADLGLYRLFLVFNEDGTGSLTNEEDGSTGSVVWEISGSSLILNENMILDMKDGQLAFADEENGSIMYFSPGEAVPAADDPLPADLPQADPAGDADLDITGTWNLTYLKKDGRYFTPADAGIGAMSLEISEDGAITITYQDQSASAQWLRAGTLIFVHASDGNTQFIIENGNITYEVDGIKMILTR